MCEAMCITHHLPALPFQERKRPPLPTIEDLSKLLSLPSTETSTAQKKDLDTTKISQLVAEDVFISKYPELVALFPSFGITYPVSKTELAITLFHKQLIKRVQIILDALKNSPILTNKDKERTAFSSLTPKEISHNPVLLSMLFKLADDLNLATIFSGGRNGGPLLPQHLSIAKQAELLRAWCKENTVTKIQCNFLFLTAIPYSIFAFSDLETLDLSYNSISALPKDLCRLKNLSVLFVNNNQIIKIPDAIGELVNLRHFSAENNSLVEVSKRIGNLANLIFLSLANNLLCIIPEEINALKELRALYLEKNLLQYLPPLDRLTQLVSLSLSHNFLSAPPESLWNLPELRDLLLDNNQIETVPQEVEQATRLQRLSLSGNPIKKISKEVRLPDSLQRLIMSTLPRKACRTASAFLLQKTVFFSRVCAHTGKTVMRDQGEIQSWLERKKRA